MKILDEKNTIEILDSIFKDKLLEPGSYRGRKNTSLESFDNTQMVENMLKKEDRIFKNLYNNYGWEIDKAIERNDWKNTRNYFKGREWIINEVKKSELRGRGGAGFSTGLKWSLL